MNQHTPIVPILVSTVIACGANQASAPSSPNVVLPTNASTLASAQPTTNATASAAPASPTVTLPPSFVEASDSLDRAFSNTSAALETVSACKDVAAKLEAAIGDLTPLMNAFFAEERKLTDEQRALAAPAGTSLTPDTGVQRRISDLNKGSLKACLDQQDRTTQATYLALQAEGMNLTMIAAFGGANVPNVAPDASLPQAPRADVQIGGGDAWSSADARVITSLRARYRSCFNSTLNQNPDQSDGKSTIQFGIAQNGDVTYATVNAPNMPESLVSCLAHATKLAQFDAAPAHTLTLKVMFQKKQ
jgi:hypothetical protein